MTQITETELTFTLHEITHDTWKLCVDGREVDFYAQECENGYKAYRIVTGGNHLPAFAEDVEFEEAAKSLINGYKNAKDEEKNKSAFKDVMFSRRD